MAFLLGNESCIESLRSDLNDIQDTINEILVRSGPIKCYSWKSPDKLASDLKINELIERYKFGTDEVDNQVAHYSLLELIVDRLLLLVYISTNYVDQAAGSNEQNSTNNNSKITRLSAGLATKKFWNRFTQLCSSYRQLNCQVKSNTVKQKNSEEMLRSSLNQSNKPKQSNANGANKQIAEEVSSKSVQTNDTAFVPCESCAKVQTNLKQNADRLISMCYYQNITSQVGIYRSNLMGNQLVGGWLNGSDLEKWLIEQDKDLDKLDNKLKFLAKNNESLKTKLSENEASMAKIIANEKELKKNLKEEVESREITAKQYEKKISDLKTELQNKIKSLETELKNLTQLKTSLEEKNESLRNLYENNEKIVVELNETNKVLTQELDNKTELRLKSNHLEEEKLLLAKEIEFLKRELNDKTNDLNNERTKLENLIRSEQSLKLKHEATLESFDKLSADYESIKKKFEYIDEEKKQIIDSVKYKEQQIESLKYESEILQNSINNLKLELKKMKDNELLLIKYPDLYGPIEQLNDEELNVVDDMQNQINANKHRIYLLDNLNKKLLNSIKKMNQSNQIRSNSSNGYVMESLNETNISTVNDDRNYFMKPPESSSRSIQSNLTTPKNSEKNSYTRPVPLFKLENEIENYEHKNEEPEERPVSIKKYWNQDDSIIRENTNRSLKSNSKEKVLDVETDRTKTPISVNYRETIKTPKDFTLELDNDDDFDFMKDKHQSDKNYLEKLNQISQTSELRIENTELSLINKNSRRGSKDNSYLFSPSQSSMNSERNVPTPGAYPSRASNYSAHSRLKTPPPIPPADKNMEVVVGKGRRVNSASGSARSNISTSNTNNNTSFNNNNNNNNKKNDSARGKPPPSRGAPNDKTSFKCDNCNKKYDDIKNFDIHKLYCTK